MKSEPDEFSIDDLAAAPGKTTAWFGVRNYQARNFMLKEMQIGDRSLLSLKLSRPGNRGHRKSLIGGVSRCKPVRYGKKPLLRHRAKRESPRWFNVDVQFVKRPAGRLAELRGRRELSKMRHSRRATAFHHPVSADEWNSSPAL